MKTIIILLLGLGPMVIKPVDLTRDLSALQVIARTTLYNGVYYQYEIKNSGNTVIPAGSYTVFFKVNGKTISFDKETTAIEPGQVIRYKSSKTFYRSPKNDNVLRYELVVKYDDVNASNNILTGETKLE